MIDIDATEFLETVFADLDDGEHVCITQAMPRRDDPDQIWFKSYLETDRTFTKWDPSTQARACYYCVSTVSGALNAKETMVSRKRADLVRYHVLVLDDIGPGGKTGEPPVEPSYKLETSEQNGQWGYFLDPGSDFGLFEAVIEAIHQLGYGDEGAGGSYRVVRIPGSANLKAGKGEFRSRVTEWHTDRVWTLAELAAAFGLDINKLAKTQTRRRKVSQTQSGTLPDQSSIDPLYIWLGDRGHIIHDDGVTDFIDVVCPWHTEHTTGGNTAGYSPLGRGDGDWVQSRGFKCLHAHCLGRGFSDAMKEWGDAGAPRVSGVDPLPWLQHRFTYIGMGKQVADLIQRTHGGEWVWELEDWGNMHKGRVMVPGRDTPIEMKTAFLEHKKTRKVTGTQYWPVKAEDDKAVFEIGGQEFVNVYVPPNWPHTSDEPDTFLDHIDFLLPDDGECDLFLDWLAHKVQNPDVRSYAMVMIAEDGFGVGRSWLKAMMARVLQGKVQTATLPQLIGKGTLAEQNYNSWAARCQLLVVEEAKDNITKEDFYNGYETFKQNVDTRIMSVRVNPKYGRTRDDFMWFNALIFSNHSDALAIPVNDRRICVLTNPSVMADAGYYDRLEGGLNDEEAARVYWHLMERELADFDHVYPPMTPGKTKMTEQNVMPSEAIKDHIVNTCEGEIFTKKMLKARILVAADALDYDGIVRSPGGIVRTLWGKMGKLRDDVNGARYYIGGGQTEVRAISDKKKWMDADKDRRRELFEEEILKNDKTGGLGLRIVTNN